MIHFSYGPTPPISTIFGKDEENKNGKIADNRSCATTTSSNTSPSQKQRQLFAKHCKIFANWERLSCLKLRSTDLSLV